MAKDSKKVVDESIGAFKRLTEQVKEYKNELASLTVGTKEWTATAEKLRNAQKQVDAINKAAKGTFVDYSKAQQNSINALKERIKLLNQERNAMDMNSKEYKEATAELKVLNDQLREAGTSAGDWKANVGNYANSIKDAFGQLGSATNGLTGSIGGLNAGMLKLASNPIGAVILALTAAIGALAKGIKSSEENTNKWNEAMIPVRTVMTMLERSLQNIASKFVDFANGLRQSESAGKAIQTILKVLVTLFEQTKTRITNLAEGIKNVFNRVKEGVGKFKEWGNGLKGTFEPVIDFVDKIKDALKQKLQPAIDWIIDKYNWLAKSDLGKILGMQTIEQVKDSWEKAGEVVDKFTEEYKKTEEEVEKVVKAENKLGETLRGLTVAQAKYNAEAEKYNRIYREAIEDEDYVTAQEALVKKQEAELKAAKAATAVAAAQANVLRQQLALTDSTAEAKMALAQAEAAVVQAQAQEEATAAAAAREQTKLNKIIDADKKKKQADALKQAVAELNQELNKYAQNYTNAVSSIKQPDKLESGDVTKDSLAQYRDQVQANAQYEYDVYAQMVEAKIAKLEEWIAAEKAKGNEVLAQETELAKLREEQASGYAKQYAIMTKKNSDADKEYAKNLKALQKSEIKGYADLFDAVSGLFEQNTVAYKATAVAKAIINTYLAASSALADTPGGPIAKGIAMAATIAAGLANVVSILKVDAKGESNAPSSSTPAIAEPTVYQQNPYTYTRTVQTYEEEDALNQPVWVSVQDISRGLNKVNVRDSESTF